MSKPLTVDRFVGLELEVSERYWASDVMPRKTNVWKKKEDGSVHSYGVEYVFDGKRKGNEAVDAVNRICDFFHREQGFIRTRDVNNGFHIHLDYSDKSVTAAITLCEVAHSIAPWMFNTVESSRDDNGYCERYAETPKQLLADSIYRFGYDKYAAEKFSRYKWIHPVQMQQYLKQTVEIRLHHGTGDRDEILTWAEWWTTLANCVDKGKILPCESRADYSKLLDAMTVSEKTYNRFLKSLESLGDADD